MKVIVVSLLKSDIKKLAKKGTNMTFKAILSVTLILFSVIDIIGNIPVIINLKEKGNRIEPGKTTLISGIIMIIFLFFGEGVLSLFGVDVGSFAIAGGIVIFIIGLEMVLGADFFKDSGTIASASIVPMAFPFIAGAGTLTTLLSLRAEYVIESVIIGIIVNLLVVYLVIRSSDWLQAKLGEGGAAVLRKVFGIILLAISIKLIKTNL